jgi:hypothetical protein
MMRGILNTLIIEYITQIYSTDTRELEKSGIIDGDAYEEVPMSNYHTEEFHINGEELLGKIKELIHEGNIRRIIIKNKDGKTLIEFPMTLGVVGAVLAPTLAAVGAVAALIGEATVVVEKNTQD